MILSITTSSNICDISLLKEKDNILFELDNICENAKNSHSIVLAPNIDKILKRNNVNIKDLKELNTEIGPGSFTGIRIGLATLKGLSIANDIPIKAISSLDSYVANLDDLVFPCFISSIINDKNNFCYFKLFYLSNTSDLFCIFPESYISYDEALDILNNIQQLEKLENKLPQNIIKQIKQPILPLYLVGENIDINFTQKLNNLYSPKINIMPKKQLSATNIAQFIFKYKDFVNTNPNPLYLKKVQAQIDLEKRNGN